MPILRKCRRVPVWIGERGLSLLHPRPPFPPPQLPGTVTDEATRVVGLRVHSLHDTPSSSDSRTRQVVHGPSKNRKGRPPRRDRVEGRLLPNPQEVSVDPDYPGQCPRSDGGSGLVAVRTEGVSGGLGATTTEVYVRGPTFPTPYVPLM